MTEIPARLKSIRSYAEFRNVLDLERSIILVSLRDREPSILVKPALSNLAGRWPVFQLFPNDLPETWKWLNNILEPSDDQEPTAEAIVWLKQGSIVDWLLDSDTAANPVIARITHDCFELGRNHPPGTPRPMASFDPELLKILCCPDTHQPLKLATSELLDKLNARIATGHLQNIARQPIKEKLSGGVLRDDGAILYPMRENIPILLVDEGIPLV